MGFLNLTLQWHPLGNLAENTEAWVAPRDFDHIGRGGGLSIWVFQSFPGDAKLLRSLRNTQLNSSHTLESRYYNANVYSDTGFPVALVVKNPPANAEDLGWIPGSERCPGEEKGNSLQCSGLENPKDRGTWWATVQGVAKVGHDFLTEVSTSKIQKPYYPKSCSQ